MTHRIALLGSNIEYSRSPSVHRAIAQAIGEDIVFDVFDVKYDELKNTVERLLKEYDGFFVTRPYKTEVNKFLGRSGELPVNVVRSRDRAAFNTDGIGLLRALDRNFPDWDNTVSSALVLGAGGAARSTAVALKERGKTVYVLNRTLMHAVKLCSACGAELYANQPCELAVNCTDVGRNGDDVLKSLCVLPDFAYAYDLIYGVRTPFAARCERSGAKTATGEDMLVFQAIEGDKLLFGAEFDTAEAFAKASEILKTEENGSL